MLFCAVLPGLPTVCIFLESQWKSRIFFLVSVEKKTYASCTGSCNHDYTTLHSFTANVFYFVFWAINRYYSLYYCLYLYSLQFMMVFQCVRKKNIVCLWLLDKMSRKKKWVGNPGSLICKNQHTVHITAKL